MVQIIRSSLKMKVIVMMMIMTMVRVVMMVMMMYMLMMMMYMLMLILMLMLSIAGPPVGSTVCNHSSAPTNRQATYFHQIVLIYAKKNLNILFPHKRGNG